MLATDYLAPEHAPVSSQYDTDNTTLLMTPIANKIAMTKLYCMVLFMTGFTQDVQLAFLYIALSADDGFPGREGLANTVIDMLKGMSSMAASQIQLQDGLLLVCLAYCLAADHAHAEQGAAGRDSSSPWHRDQESAIKVSPITVCHLRLHAHVAVRTRHEGNAPCICACLHLQLAKECPVTAD